MRRTPRGFELPPEGGEFEGEWDRVGPVAASARAGFIFPPPQRSSSRVYENARRVAEEINQIGVVAENSGQEVQNLGVVVADYGDALERKVEPWAVPTIAPLSQTINRRADPVFGLSDFMTPGGWTGTPGGGDTHRHPLGTAGGAEWSAAVGANSKGRAYMAFITPAINRVYERINFLVGAESNPCRMDVGVYVLEPDTKLWRRQALKLDVPAPIVESVATVELDDPWIATQGSYVAIAWLQHGSGNVRDLLGLNDTPRPLPDFVYPHKISAIHTSTNLSSLPATINGETQTDFDFWFTPYAELSENVGIPLRTFTENWPDVGEAQRPWVHLTSPGIRSSGGYTAAGGVGTRVSVYDTPLSTDHVRVRTSVYRLFDNIQSSFIAVRATNDMTAGVGLEVSNDYGYRLIEWSGTNVNPHLGTVIQSIARPPEVGDQIEIDYLNGAVTVRINGAVEIDNAEAGGPQGAAGRFVGLRLRRDRSGVPGFYNFHPSPWLGPWSARDLPQANGDDDEDDGDEGGDEGGDPAARFPPTQEENQ